MSQWQLGREDWDAKGSRKWPGARVNNKDGEAGPPTGTQEGLAERDLTVIVIWAPDAQLWVHYQHPHTPHCPTLPVCFSPPGKPRPRRDLYILTLPAHRAESWGRPRVLRSPRSQHARQTISWAGVTKSTLTAQAGSNHFTYF